VANSARVTMGERVAVFGLGGVGLAAVLGARLAGAGTLVAIDVVPEKLELARELGATETVMGGPDAVEDVRAATDGGADKAIETVGSEKVLGQAYAATRPGGTTVTVGLPHPERMLSIPAVSLVAEERTLRGSYLGTSIPSLDVPRLVALQQAGRLPVERLLTHRIGLDELNEGFDRLASGEAVRQAVVF
jgi:alcohol dehydrogenase